MGSADLTAIAFAVDSTNANLKWFLSYRQFGQNISGGMNLTSMFECVISEEKQNGSISYSPEARVWCLMKS